MGSRWEQQPGGSDGPLPPSWSFDPYTPSPSPGDPHAGRSAEHPPGPGARGSDPDSSAPGTVGRARGAARTVGRGAAATGRATAKASVAGARLVGRGTKAGTARFRAFAGKDGARNSGLAGLTEVHAVAAAGDAALTIALASTVLALPVGQARGQVAIFLATTMAPFVLLGPFVGPLLDRFRHGRRWAIGGSLAVRAFLSWGLAGLLDGSAWLLPVALLCLVATRAYAVARSAGMPLVLPPGVTLVTANARTSIAGIIGMVLGSALAAPVSRVGPEWTLRLTFAIYAVATVLAVRLPAAVDSPPPGPEEGAPEPLLTGWRRRPEMPGRVRATLAVTSGSRVLAGFLTLFLAFLLQEQPLAGLSPLAALGLVVGVAGLGNGVGSFAGNRWGDLAPGRIAGSMLLVATAAAVVTAVHYALATVLVLAFISGAFGQLSRLCLDALIQHEVAGPVQARAFAWTETQLQLGWVVGGAVSIVLPLVPELGFAVVSGALAAVVAASVVIRRRSLAAAEAPAGAPGTDVPGAAGPTRHTGPG